ncbi:alanine--glyoxylate aminotransferase family protein [Candidatus Poribacteria bacterium]|nr:alanine--glyoxylate aminotransferase family protein [Candidatus Poribacteria bacterium]
MKKEYLFTPGPTPIPTEALLSMARPIDYHRSPESANVIKEVAENLKHVFQTQNDVLILTSSGTGAMEGAVANLLSPSDKVLVIRSGKFGERWGEICVAYGVEFVSIDIEPGLSVEPQAVADILKSNPDIKAVFSTLCETSTGALHDIEALGQITRDTPTLLVVDAVSALGADDLQMDNWHVDVVVSCSQKGLMTPPGLGFASLSERAWEAVEKSTLPKYYFDFQKARSELAKGSTPYTPAITFIIALQQSLRLICDEGIRNVLSRHARLAEATRAAVKALGLQLFAAHPANTLTSIRFPGGLDSKAFVNNMRKQHGITYAGGQEELSGKIIRIAHLGWMNEYDVMVAISALEMGLAEAGYNVKLGAGVTAAEQIFTTLG